MAEALELMTMEEFRALPQKTQVETMTSWRQEYKNDQIVAALGTSPGSFYALLKELNIPTRKRTMETMPAQDEGAAKHRASVVQSSVPASVPPTTFSVRYTGSPTGIELARRLSMVAAALDGDEQRYSVQLVIEDTHA